MCKPWKRHFRGKPYPIVTQLRAVRKSQGLRLDVLAEIIGYHWVTVSRWERGERLPSFQALHDWSQALGVNPTVTTKHQEVEL